MRALTLSLLRVCTALTPSLIAIEQAAAQAPSIPPPQEIVRDENGVDLANGTASIMSPSISVGDPSNGGLSFQKTFDGDIFAWRHNFEGSVNDDYVNGIRYVTLFDQLITFTFSGGQWVCTNCRGATLTTVSGPTYVLTMPDGSVARFDYALNGMSATQANNGRIVSYTKPNGEKLEFTWKQVTGGQRLQSVTNNFGYQIKFDYPDNNSFEYEAVRAINNAVDYCDPMANSCSLTQNWPSLTFQTQSNGAGTTIYYIDDNMTPSRQTRYTTVDYGTSRTIGIRRPSSSSDNILYTYGNWTNVTSVDDWNGTWTYTRSVSPSYNVTVTDPLSHTRTYFLTGPNVTAFTNGVGQTWNYTYGSGDVLTSVVAPEGNETRYTYDARGNITEMRQIAKSGSGLSDLVVTADYDSTCSNTVTCNQPNWIQDARGNLTDFTYDSTSGALLTVTAPAPTSGAVRPQTRYTYAMKDAYYKDSGGSIVQAPTSIERLITVSSCATLSSCANGADEKRVSIAYGAINVANNLQPTSITTASGNGALSATVTTTYDNVGNVSIIDGPLAGTDDQTRFRYDDARQQIATLGPDPDGGGSLNHRATQTIYDLDGQVTSAQIGTATSWTGPITPTFSTDTTYNDQARPIEQRTYGSGVLQSITQFTYDQAGRLQCTAVRMNLSASPPSSACTGGYGPGGSDSIVANTYDDADRITQIVGGYNSATQVALSTFTYTANGQQATMADGKGNLSTFEYDGFDRLKKLRYPTAANGSVSSATDYEEYGFDANGNVTSTRLRDATTITSTFDALNRETKMDAPSGTNDVDYKYDNFNRRTEAKFPSSHTLGYTFDILDRMTKASGPLGDVDYQYDLAGRRTQMTWPDSFYVTYDYNLYSDTLAIRENGASSGAGVLATYAYDDFGRRTSLTRGNGVITSYTYDNASRVSAFTNDFVTGTDYTSAFTFGAADQQLTRTTSSSAHVYTPTTGTTPYTTNGLNQYPAVNSVTQTYDTRGNLTNDGARTLGYDALNRLTSVTGGYSYSYDPIGRLYEQSGVAAPKRQLYDGVDLIGDYASGSATVLNRYVFGPGVDEALVSYAGSGTSSRTWFTADERGSILNETDGNGAATATNAYDEYGRPNPSNASRFQYTGQAWLPDIALYYYKARVYDPARGGFLQTDPIGYAGGTNLYAYVGNDPINFVDPLGLDEIIVNGNTCRHFATCSDYDASAWQNSLGRYGVQPGGVLTDDFGAKFDPITLTVTARRPTQLCNVACQTARVQAFRHQTDLAFFGQFGTIIFGDPNDPLTYLQFTPLRALKLGCGCFEAGTEVQTPNGLRRIEDIKVGDLVLAWDEKTGNVTPQPVTALIRPEPKPTYELTLRDTRGEIEVFKVTDDHPWFIEATGWVATKDLKQGQRIETGDARGMEILSLSSPGPAVTTYNLEVAGVHTYLVGEDGAVVHNVCPIWRAGANHAKEWVRYMFKRGWTPRAITQTVRNGERLSAVNRVNPGNPASRIVNPTTGKSIVQDDVTKEIIQLGGPGFLF